MSQLNLDKLSLAPPVGVCPPLGRRSDAPTSERFDEHLDRAGRAGRTESPQATDNRAAEPSGRDDDTEPPAAQDTAEAAEPEAKQHDEKPSDAARSEADEKSKPSEADGDAADAATANQEKDADGADRDEVLLAAMVAAPPQNADAPPQAVVQSEVIVGPSQSGSDADAGVKVESTGTTLQPDAPSESAEEHAVATEAETSRPPAGEGADPGEFSVEAAGAATESKDFTPAAEQASSAATPHKNQEKQPTKAQPGRSDAKTAAVAGAPAPDAAQPHTSGGETSAIERHTPREADAASIRPAPSAPHGAADAGPSGAETTAVGPNTGHAAARPQATGAASQSAAAIENTSLPPADTTDRVRFVQRVSRALEAASSRGGSVRLRLHPPDLGSIHVELSVRHGEMTARLHTESSDARNLLLDNLPALRQRLAEHNITVQRFDVELGLGTSGGSPQGAGNPWQGYENQAYAGNSPGRPGESRVETADAPAARGTRWGMSQFDVTI